MINTYEYSVSRPEYFKQLAVKDLLFLHYICPQIEKYLYVYSHFNQISFTLEGDKVFHHGSRTWHLTSNTSIFARKTAWKQEMGTKGWEILSFYFPDHFLKRFFQSHRQQLPLRHLPEPPKEMMIEISINEMTRAFFYSIVPYFSQENPPAEELLELKFNELLYLILSNPDNTALLAYVNSMSDQHKPPLDEIMEGNFCFNLSLAEYARMAQRSLATFKRDFTGIYHTSPGRWLANKKIEYAKHLLDTSKKNINEIAYDSGFESAAHFSRLFKEKFGIAPLQCRKQNKA